MSSQQLIDPIEIDTNHLPDDFILPCRTNKKRPAAVLESTSTPVLTKRARKKIAQLERKNKLKEQENRVKPLLRAQKLDADQARKLDLLQRLSDPRVTRKRFLALYKKIEELEIPLTPTLKEKALFFQIKYDDKVAKAVAADREAEAARLNQEAHAAKASSARKQEEAEEESRNRVLPPSHTTAPPSESSPEGIVASEGGEIKDIQSSVAAETALPAWLDTLEKQW